MDAQPDADVKRASPRRWVAAALYGCAALATLVLVAALAARWRPAAAIRWAPRRLVLALVGWATDAHADEAVRAAELRLPGNAVDEAADALDASSGRLTRRGAWLVIGGPSGPWRDGVGPWRPLLVPWLGSDDVARRADARAVYRLICHQDLGLRWFRLHQDGDGGWSAAGTPIAPGYVPGAVGVSALATLTFLGAGYDHRIPSAYKLTVARAVAHLVAGQQGDGALAADARDHALAAMALAEAYAMTSDPTLRAAAQRAVAHVGDGFAGASLPDDALLVDLAAMAVRSAKAAGLVAPRERLDAAIAGAWSSVEDVAAAWRRVDGTVEDADAVVALGTIDLWLRPAARRAALHDCAVMTAARVDVDAWSPFMLEQASLLVFQDGTRWTAWTRAVQPELLDRQRLGDPATDGSWDPPDGDERDRAAVTACRALALEIYYRYSGVPTPSTGR